MAANTFTFKDFEQECTIQENCYSIDGRKFGTKIFIPEELHSTWPYNANAYRYMQLLRELIFELGTVEFPDLPINKTNYTIAMRSPKEHTYSNNPFLTDFCQSPHQDTPPYPTAFWLDEHRKFAATWLMSTSACEAFYQQLQNSDIAIDALHRKMVPETLENGSAILVNHTPGLILIDNSQHHLLYHARTCKFEAMDADPDHTQDAPMYAFNEIGLMQYIDTMDERRGNEFRDETDKQITYQFMAQNPL